MEKLLLIKDLTKFPLEYKYNSIWQPFELNKDSNIWYLPIDAKEDLIKNNINFEEVEV